MDQERSHQGTNGRDPPLPLDLVGRFLQRLSDGFFISVSMRRFFDGDETSKGLDDCGIVPKFAPPTWLKPRVPELGEAFEELFIALAPLW